MKDKICYEPLVNVATIHTGINITTLRRKGFSTEEADPRYCFAKKF